MKSVEGERLVGHFAFGKKYFNEVLTNIRYQPLA